MELAPETEFVVIDSAEEGASDLFRWNSETTRILIDVYRNNIGNVGKQPPLAKKKDLWILIANEINKLGYNLTSVQIRNRMTTLERAFHKNPNRLLINDLDIDCALKELFSSEDSARAEFSTTAFTSQKVADESDQSWTSTNITVEENENISVEDKMFDISEPGVTNLCRWDHNTTKLLLDIYDEVNQDGALMAQLKKRNNMWNLVTEKLNEHGFIFSSIQVQNRMKTIERAYRRHVERKRNNNLVTSFPFEDRIRKVVKSHYQLSRIKTAKRSLPDSDDDDISNIILGDAAPVSIDFLDAFGENSPLVKEIRMLRQEQNDFRIEISSNQDRRLQLLEEQNTLLRENNELLKQMLSQSTNSSDVRIQEVCKIDFEPS